MSTVEELYRSHIDSLTPVEKMRRVEQLLSWTRDLLARTIRAEAGDVNDEQLRWEVARRLYGGDARFLKLLDERAPNVSR